VVARLVQQALRAQAFGGFIGVQATRLGGQPPEARQDRCQCDRDERAGSDPRGTGSQ
jgi:hypothetical protein